MTKAEIIKALEPYPDDMEFLTFDENRKEWREIKVISQTRVRFNGNELIRGLLPDTSDMVRFYIYDLHNNEAELKGIIN